MAIRTREPVVPTRLPPTYLFLDDLEEIVSVLKELAATASGGETTIVTFSVGNQDFDDIADLRRIGKTKSELKIEVEKGRGRTWMSIAPWLGAMWSSYGYTSEDAWSAYHKLEVIFNRRPRRWSAFYQSLAVWHSLLIWFLSWAVISAVLYPAVSPRLHMNDKLGAVMLISMFLTLGIQIPLLAAGYRQTPIMCRYSWEPSPLGSYLKDKIVPLVIGAVLGSLVTLIELFIQHKFWP